MIRIMPFVLIVVLSSCSLGEQPKSISNSNVEESIVENEKVSDLGIVENEEPKEIIFDLRKADLQGHWASSADENLDFTIEGDSLFYLEHNQAAFYRIKSDTLDVVIDGLSFKTKVLRADSLLVRIDNLGDTIVQYKRWLQF